MENPSLTNNPDMAMAGESTEAESLLRPGERLDDLQRNGYKLIQNPDAFCFGIDAVLLSSYAKVKRGEKCVDLGCGNGIIPILMEAKTAGRHFTGLEIQDINIDLANRNVLLNRLEGKIDIVQGDIKEASTLLGTDTYDVVTSNPPYMTEHHGIINDYDVKSIARHEIMCSLEDVIREASRLLKQNGRFYMVHRPFRLAEIMSLMTKYKLEPKHMRLVHPYADKEPNMVLIEGMKGARPRITIEKPLVVYGQPGVYTDEIYEIYGYK